jgi:hypothetical protein
MWLQIGITVVVLLVLALIVGYAFVKAGDRPTHRGEDHWR